MEIVTEFDKHTQEALVLSIGMFDGVHKGHLSIIRELKKVSESKNLKTGILSFSPHPRMVLEPKSSIKLLNTIEEKSSLLEVFGIDFLFIKEFNESFRNLEAEVFVKEILVNQLNVKSLIIGYDHVFGKNKTGTVPLLQRMGQDLGFEVIQLPAITESKQNVSSTKIRNALLDGDVGLAADFLGYPYQLSGKVIHGKKIGRSIGYPTANIDVDSCKILPKEGAYIVETYIEDTFFKGMFSIGSNPTVSSEKLALEVHILDFDGDIYDQNIKVCFRAFLHEQIKFDSLLPLIKRLDEDQKLTRAYSF